MKQTKQAKQYFDTAFFQIGNENMNAAEVMLMAAASARLNGEDDVSLASMVEAVSYRSVKCALSQADTYDREAYDRVAAGRHYQFAPDGGSHGGQRIRSVLCAAGLGVYGPLPRSVGDPGYVYPAYPVVPYPTH